MPDKVFGTDFSDNATPLATSTISINNGTTLEDVLLSNLHKALSVPAKYSSASAPDVNKDTLNGYKVDDVWVETTNKVVYICVDATTGAAVWSKLDVTATSTTTFTNKRITRRVNTTASSATPTINTDTTDLFTITALATNITSFTTNLSGTPSAGDLLEVRILDNGTARTIAWGASFASRGVTLPTTTVISKYLRVLFEWNATTSTWDCIAIAQEA